MLVSPYGSPAPPSPASYSPGPGGFDPRVTYAAAGAPYGHPSQGYAPMPSAQAPYDPFAAIGAAMAQQHPPSSAPQSSYAPSVSSVPSSQYPNRPLLSVVGGSSSTGNTTDYSDSIADLKRRQQQVVNSYEQGISGAHSPPMQHTDSGIRSLDPDEPGPSELPPVYTPN